MILTNEMLPYIDIGGWMDWILTDVSPAMFVQSFSGGLSSAAYIGSLIGPGMSGQVYLIFHGFDG